MTSELYGQATTAPIDPFGQIFSASVRPEAQQINARKFAATPSAAFTFLGIGVRDSSSATSGSFSFGYGNSAGGHDFLVIGTYSHIDADEGEGADRATAYGELAIASAEFIAVSVVGVGAYDPDAFKTYSVVLVAEHKFTPDKLKATANLGWTAFKPDGEASVDDFQPAVGVSLSPDKGKLWTFSIDYTFKNDVDGEDSGSFAAARKLQSINSTLKFSAEKHNVFGLSLARVF
jgi:hypothetical protein